MPAPVSRAQKRAARRAASTRALSVNESEPAAELPERWAVEPAPTDQPCPAIVQFLTATLMRTYERAADRRWGELLRMVDAAPDGSTLSPKQRAAYTRELARRGDLMVQATRAWWKQYGAYWLEAPEATEAALEAGTDDAADVDAGGDQ